MCKRYSFALTKQKIARRYNVNVRHAPEANYNVAPGQTVAAIINTQPNDLSVLQWGMPAFGRRSEGAGNRLIANVNSSTILRRPGFAELVQTKRCLVLADGFYLWKRVSKQSKVPFRVVLQWNVPFAFAGIWNECTDPEGKPAYSCAILLTTANSLIRPVSNLMPVVLSIENEREWLNTSQSDDTLLSMLAPLPAERMNLFPVSPQVNEITNNSPDFTKPAQPMDQFGNYILFHDQ